MKARYFLIITISDIYGLYYINLIWKSYLSGIKISPNNADIAQT